mgnify:FL=1
MMTRHFLLLITLTYIGLGASGCTPAVTTLTDEAGAQAVVRTGAATGTAGLVASAHRRATEAGLEMLELGGNAFDAAVAVAATLTVVEPMNSNIFGGYGTVILYDAIQEQLRYLDNNGRFPLATNSDVFRQAASPDVMRTAMAVSTPGNLHGFEAMWQAYGSLPWATLWEPAAFHADEGVAVTAPLARAIAATWDRFPDRAKQIYGAGGEPFGEGDWLGQHELAASMRRVAAEGSAALYGGPIGEAVIAEVERGGGFLAMTDLVDHQPEWFEPISIEYREHQVVTAGAPSNSFAALVATGIMSLHDAAALGSNTTAYLHRFAEATKHAFWTRLRYAGGPEVNPPPLDMLLSEAYWQQQVDTLDTGRASSFQPPGPAPQEGADTTHFVVADQWGNVVSATITLGQIFGSTVFVEDAGIWLNNSMAYSTYEPKGNPMDAMPGNRKHSSKSPTIIMKNGRPWAALGSPGGHTIPQTVAQLTINLIDFDMDVQTAVDAGRIAFAEPDVLLVEELVPVAVRDELDALGHHVRSTDRIGLAHALRIDYDINGTPIHFVGAADGRGVGTAIGLDIATSSE